MQNLHTTNSLREMKETLAREIFHFHEQEDSAVVKSSSIDLEIKKTIPIKILAGLLCRH